MILPSQCSMDASTEARGDELLGREADAAYATVTVNATWTNATFATELCSQIDLITSHILIYSTDSNPMMLLPSCVNATLTALTTIRLSRIVIPDLLDLPQSVNIIQIYNCSFPSWDAVSEVPWDALWSRFPSVRQFTAVWSRLSGPFSSSTIPISLEYVDLTGNELSVRLENDEGVGVCLPFLFVFA